VISSGKEAVFDRNSGSLNVRSRGARYIDPWKAFRLGGVLPGFFSPAEEGGFFV